MTWPLDPTRTIAGPRTDDPPPDDPSPAVRRVSVPGHHGGPVHPGPRPGRPRARGLPERRDRAADRRRTRRRAPAGFAVVPRPVPGPAGDRRLGPGPGRRGPAAAVRRP